MKSKQLELSIENSVKNLMLLMKFSAWDKLTEENKIHISQSTVVILEEFKLLQTKSSKWDALYEKIAIFYGDGGSDEDTAKSGHLLDIGEAAATAFGYL